MTALLEAMSQTTATAIREDLDQPPLKLRRSAEALAKGGSSRSSRSKQFWPFAVFAAFVSFVISRRPVFMRQLVVSRPGFAAILLARVGVCIWTDCRAEATAEPDAKRQPEAKRRQ